MGDAGFLPVRPALGDHAAGDCPVPFGNEVLSQGLGLGSVSLGKMGQMGPEGFQFRSGRLIPFPFFRVFSDLFNRSVNIGHRARTVTHPRKGCQGGN